MADPFTTFNASRFTLLGPRWADDAPLWSAAVTLLTEPVGRAARTAFAEATPRDLIPGPTDELVQFPGTLLARLRIDSVRLRFGSHLSTNFPAVTPPEGTFLIAAEPDRWIPNGTQLKIDFMTCIAGQFDLKPFFGPKLENLPAFLKAGFAGLLPDGPVELAAASSGFLLEGQPRLPDAAAPLANPLPLLAEVVAPSIPEPDAGTLALRLDRERLSLFEPGRRELLNRFQALEQRLNPAVENSPLVKWLRLELADGTRMPEFDWRIRPSDPANPNIQFASGEWRAILADQSPRVPLTPPRGVLTGQPDVTWSADGIAIKAGSDAPANAPAAVVSAVIENPGMPTATATETVKLTGIDLSYDPVAAADWLRAVNGIPRPQLHDSAEDSDSALVTGRAVPKTGPIEPPLLWGFLPLDDGWAQLPFFNLTEQILIDALPPKSKTDPAPVVSPSQFRGAAIFGTDRVELFDPNDGRSPWNLAILDADSVRGTWTFTDNQLTRVTLTLSNPEVTAEGLFELATQPPSAADAIPSLENWVSALASLPLRTAPADDLFPSPFVLHVGEVSFNRVLRKFWSVASMTAWDWTYAVNERALTDEVTPTNPSPASATVLGWLTAFSEPRSRFKNAWRTTVDAPVAARAGLIWQRHPTQPCVQVLPLTQSAEPANALSASRQLAPFELPLTRRDDAPPVLVPDDWHFRSTASDRWPVSVEKTPAAREWAANPRLGFALLGLPGAALALASPDVTDPVQDSSGFLNRLVYRHDLPLLDQPNALAEVPKERDGPVEEPFPPALDRDGYAAFWKQLDDKALFAETDEAEALQNGTANVIRGLSEPRLWPANVGVNWDRYPGTLTFTEAGGAAIILDGEAKDALRGIDGRFDATGNTLALTTNAAAPVTITGHSYAAQVEIGADGRRMRDQRGLLRGGATATTNRIVTPVSRQTAAGPEPLTLVTFRTAEPLTILPGKTWHLWVRDLPTTGTDELTFDPATAVSDERRGVNDPASDSREFNHRAGFEWRLAGEDATVDWLPLGPLAFFPLSLGTTTLAADGGVSVAIIGRLQLPMWNGTMNGGPSRRELREQDAVVKVTFTDGVLKSVGRADPDPDPNLVPDPHPQPAPRACWPLMDVPGGVTAVIRWKCIELSSDGKSLRLPADQYQIEYLRQGVRWTVAGTQPLTVPLVGPNPAPVAFDFELAATAEAGVERLRLAFDLIAGRHALTADWVFRLGDGKRLQFVAGIHDDILAPTTDANLEATFVHATKSLKLKLADAKVNLDSGGLAFAWTDFDDLGTQTLHLLPGLELAKTNACRGGAALAFDIVEDPDVPGMQAISLRGGSFDAVLECAWGDSIADRDPLQPPTATAVYGSSGGRVRGEFLCTRAPGATGSDRWPGGLTLSGLIEIRNLITWPGHLAVDGRFAATLPAVADRPFHHWRHSMRVLLAEHQIPAAVLVGSEQPDCFLTLAPDAVWTIPAAVDHHLILLEGTESAPQPVVPAAEHRFAAVQEVRLASPAALHARLASANSTNALDATFPEANGRWVLGSTPTATHGLQSREMLKALKVIDFDVDPWRVIAFEQSELKNLAGALIVDASASIFIRGLSDLEQKDQKDRPGTPVIAIADGAVLAGVAQRSDTDHDPTLATPEWLIAPLPFLGRLQAKTRDEDGGLFAKDPVRVLANLPAAEPVPILERALAHRGGRTPDTIQTAAFDTSGFRLFRRLDASSLAESWSRLLRARVQPEAPPKPDALAGIAMATAADTALASAKPGALAPLFDPRRRALPPNIRNQFQPLPAAASSGFVWTPAAVWQIQTAFTPALDANHPYAFLALPLALTGSRLLAAGTVRHPAATLIPCIPLTDESSPRWQPVSLALSPFAGFQFQQWPNNTRTPILATGELLVLTAARTGLQSVADQVIHAGGKSSVALDNGFRDWAVATHSQLAADSPVALLRIRELDCVADANQSKLGVAIDFRFAAVPLPADPKSVRGTAAVTVRPERRREAQGQFGGVVLPDLAAASDFELAPPLVRGLQPFREPARRKSEDDIAWPWGVAGLRASTAFRQANGADLGSVGTGTSGPTRLWWRALALRVQYARQRTRPRLPPGFRAPAIAGFVPAWPRLLWPDAKRLAACFVPLTDRSEVGSPAIDAWRPVLPGRVRTLATGLRPGVPYAFRDTVTTQPFDGKDMKTGVPFTSGSVPVQHRAPRPVLLAPSLKDEQAIALRTWGSWFDLSADPTTARTVAVNATPAAEFLLLDAQGKGEGVRFRVNFPEGVLSRTWDGTLTLTTQLLPTGAGAWTFAVTLVVAAVAKPLELQADGSFKLPGGEDGLKVARRLIADQPPGTPVTVRVVGTAPEKTTLKKFAQAAELRLRTAGAPFASPFVPRYLSFEDPEYNRRLSSKTARSEKLNAIHGGMQTVALVADRREYNRTGAIAFALTAKGSTDFPVSALLVNFHTIDRTGTPSAPIGPKDTPLLSNTFPPSILDSIEKLTAGTKLSVGDTLRIHVTGSISRMLPRPVPDPNPALPVETVPVDLSLDLAIVGTPVTPVTEAAYAVLRGTGTTDECVRFAWGPMPERIELVNPDDLLGSLVRRRAIFAVIDTVNAARAAATTYAVQKCTAHGSTHFPGIMEAATK